MAFYVAVLIVCVVKSLVTVAFVSALTERGRLARIGGGGGRRGLLLADSTSSVVTIPDGSSSGGGGNVSISDFLVDTNISPHLMHSLQLADEYATQVVVTRQRRHGAGGWAHVLSGDGGASDAPPTAPSPHVKAFSYAGDTASSQRGGLPMLPILRDAFSGQLTAKSGGGREGEGGEAEGEERTPYIVVFKDRSTVDELRAICAHHGVHLKSASGRGGGRLADPACNMPQVCRRVYSATFRGVSGFFTTRQLQRLLQCFEESVDYVEKDGLVHKMEEEKEGGEAGRTVTRADAHRVHGGAGPGPGGENAFQVSKALQDMGNSFASALRGGGYEEAGIPDPSRVRAFSGTQSQDLNVALWNLDRVDQRALPLDKKYKYGGNKKDDGTGKGVTIYTVDSGLMKDHHEFELWEGGGSRASHGWDFVDNDADASDCDGHGTHVAGTAVGRTVGIAKSAEVVAVRVLDCSGSGSVSDVVAGLDWVAGHVKKPAIVTLSLGIGLGQWSKALEGAVRNLVNEQGISVIVASGNSGVDSCGVAPGNVEETITVAASDLESKFGSTSPTDAEGLYRWSNTGECVDIFAPGVEIYSACGGESRCNEVTNEAYAWASGTSMAVPLVAGVAATYLAEFPNASPQEVKDAILEAATEGKLASPHMKQGSPNKMLYSQLWA